ncbi:MAG TPA: response regulator, partial [Burkholderiaceae bacterium]
VALRTAAPRPAKTPQQTLVLVVDDSKMVRLKTGKLLAAHGYQVAQAVDGQDAVRLLETQLPDLVVTDVDMPNLDGFGLARHLRANARTAHVPIVMITSAEDRHRDEATRAGVGLVLGKPYPEDELLAHVASFAFPAASGREAAAGAIA